jgi:putative Mg2+ transporter-C (MgtC) family protein
MPSILGLWGGSLDHLVHLVVAFLLALPIGWNRARADRSAGLRTFPLVAMASCGLVQTALSVLGPGVPNQANILQGIVTGIGFIGAGAIIRRGDITTGNATAASVWVVGIMGAAVGYGYYDIGIILAAANLAVLPIRTPFQSGSSAAGRLPRRRWPAIVMSGAAGIFGTLLLTGAFGIPFYIRNEAFAELRAIGVNMTVDQSGSLAARVTNDDQFRRAIPHLRVLGISRLDLSYSSVSRLPTLRGFDDLIQLDLTTSRISQIDSLDTFPNLRTLNLQHLYYLDKVPSLQGLTKLQSLDMSYFLLADKVSLQSLHNLEILNLSRSPIPNLQGLTKLKMLNLCRLPPEPPPPQPSPAPPPAPTTQLPPLEDLVALEILNVQNWTFQSIPSWLAQLPKLQKLFLDDSNLKHDPVLEQLRTKGVQIVNNREVSC